MKNRKVFHALLCCISLVLLLGGIALAVRAGRVTSLSSHLHRLAAESHYVQERTQTFGCEAAGNMPDEECTPGHIFPDATKEQICVSGYARKARKVSSSQKDRIYAAYGIRSHTVGEYNIDHLISLQLGGSNDDANLWPQAAEPAPGYHEKIKVENFLHGELCRGEISLQQAQRLVGQHWRDIHYLLEGVE